MSEKAKEYCHNIGLHPTYDSKYSPTYRGFVAGEASCADRIAELERENKLYKETLGKTIGAWMAEVRASTLDEVVEVLLSQDAPIASAEHSTIRCKLIAAIERMRDK